VRTVLEEADGLVLWGGYQPIDINLDLGEVPNVIPECSELEKVIEVMGRLCYRSWAPGDEWGP